MRACVVKTERTQEESVACPFFRPDETISHTVLDYVCINGGLRLCVIAVVAYSSTSVISEETVGNSWDIMNLNGMAVQFMP